MPTTPSTWLPPERRTWTFTGWWLLLMLLHIVNVVYYVGFSIFYWRIYHSNLGFQLETYSIGIATKQYRNVSAVLMAVALIHMLCFLLMVGSSIAARRLEFYTKVTLNTIIARLRCHFEQARSNPQGSVGLQQSSQRVSSLLVIQSAGRTVSSVFSREGLLGVDSVYFDDIIVIRELFETGLQSYQAYRMTQLLPHLTLIRVYVALLVTNCWCVTVFHRVYKDDDNKRRMATLVCDAVLDMVSSMGITLLIFASYAPQYTDPMFGFPLVNWFNDQWFTAVYQEFQMMLVVSWADVAFRLVFALGLLHCMHTLKEILEPAATEGPSQDAKRSDRVVNPAIQSTIERRASHPVKIIPAEPSSHYNQVHQRKHFVLHDVVPACFVLWGFGILVVHIYAESKGTDWPCSLPLRPWFTSKPACSLVQINCHELGVSGSAASMEIAWTKFEPTLTAHVTIRHCPDLVVPPAFGQYHRLTSMKVYNSSIISWTETAAITSKSHSALRALHFLRTEFVNATLPTGLTAREFPQTFRSFVASGTNLATLPDDLHHSWPPYISLALEGCRFTAVPDVVMRLQPRLLSLSINPITSVPASLFEIEALETLLLVDTLVQEVSREVVNPSPRMYLVMLSGTNVSTLWSWMDPIISRAFAFQSLFFNAQGTPFCAERDEIEAGNRTQFSAADTIPLDALASVMDASTPQKLAYSQRAVTCTQGLGPFFPLPLEDMVSAIPT